MTATTATKEPQKISDQFVNAVQATDSSAAYALTSQSFQQATSSAQLDQVIQRVGPVLVGEEKVSGRAIQKSAGSAQTAVIVYSVQTSNGMKYMRVTLQKNGDAWQVVNFKSDDKPLDTKAE